MFPGLRSFGIALAASLVGYVGNASAQCHAMSGGGASPYMMLYQMQLAQMQQQMALQSFMQQQNLMRSMAQQQQNALKNNKNQQTQSAIGTERTPAQATKKPTSVSVKNAQAAVPPKKGPVSRPYTP